MRRIEIILLLVINISALGQDSNPNLLDLQNRGFFHDREYFMIRSGRLQCIIQADRADLGPAVTYYLFDADSIRQNSKKQAFNYDKNHGVQFSALEVIMQKSQFAFTAYGEQTRVKWTKQDDIPAVDATWWADGVKVTERFSAYTENSTIRRTIVLEGSNVHGDEQLSLRLRLPAQNANSNQQAIWVEKNGSLQALLVHGKLPVKIDNTDSSVEIGPLTIMPGKTITVETFMLAQLPDHSVTDGDFQNRMDLIIDEIQRTGLLEKTQAWWVQGSRISTKDKLVQEVFDISRSVIPAIASNEGTVCVGPFQYPAEWVRDNSQFSLGLTAAGFFEHARTVLEHCIRDMLTAEGTTMIGGGFDDPDREQFDQTGELLLAVRWYTEFSGDTTLVSTYREKLVTLVDRPLNPRFRDKTGLVHNRREFWEQTMNDAYELAYNAYVVTGLREAAALAPLLKAEDRRLRWLKEADVIQEAMLKLLVENETFIKRRNVTGQKAEKLVNPNGAPDVPSMNVNHNRINPDATITLPITLGLVDPHSKLAANTIDEVEKLRNLRWFDGGYDRYDSSSEINNPGPWGIAGILILRGQHTAGKYEKSRSTLEWFRQVQGGNGGLYYEQIPLIAGSQQKGIGIVTWPTGELPYFVIRHYLGVSFDSDSVMIRPQLYPNSPPVKADLRFRSSRLKLEIPGEGPYTFAEVDGQRMDLEEGTLNLSSDFTGGTVVFHRD